jgi:hypothetical protein
LGSAGTPRHHHRPRRKIKEVPRLGQVEFEAITEIFRFIVLWRHQGPAFRVPRSNVEADAAQQAITSWVRSHKSKLQNSVHCLLPYRKKDQFKVCGSEARCPQDGDGAPLRCDGVVKHPLAGYSARD